MRKRSRRRGGGTRGQSPNRASNYFASADRARQDRELPCAADMALDVRVDVVHRRAGDRRLGGLDAPPGTPELKLRRIVTRPAVADGGRPGRARAHGGAPRPPASSAGREEAGGGGPDAAGGGGPGELRGRRPPRKKIRERKK